MHLDLKTSAVALADFFLPRICPSCGGALQLSESVMCRACFSACTTVSQRRLDQTYIHRFHQSGFISGYTSLFLFEAGNPVRDLIHSAKYGRRFKNAFWLGKLLAEVRINTLMEWKIDVIIPVPLHTRKENERGYNQSYHIAKGIGSVTGSKISAGAVKRIRYTETQTFLSITERRNNVRDAFIVRKKGLISGRKVLLTDDVLTTGSTLQECAHVMKTAGAAEVYAATAVIA